MNPVLVEVFRSAQLESQHRGAVVAVDVTGRRLLELGNVDALVYPRSSLKPFQAIPLLESGAAADAELSGQEIALCCASHNAEGFHIDVLDAWMKRLDLCADDLECGVSYPLYQPAAHSLLGQGQQPGRQHHNCSGKHTGMLTLARHFGESLAGYSDYQHRTQQMWMSVLHDLTGLDISRLPWDLDGCGLPALALPLASLAEAYAKLAALRGSGVRGEAVETICLAMNKHPELVAGTGRCCTAVMNQLPDLTVKTGAEGVFGAVSHRHGIAVALKIDDGATRGSEVALGAALLKLGLIDSYQHESLQQHFCPPVRNSQNRITGAIKPAAIWQA